MNQFGMTLNLRMFDAGASASAPAGDAGAATVASVQADDAPQTPTYRSRAARNPLNGVQYGAPQEAEMPPSPDDAGNESRDKDNAAETYKDLIRGKYKADHDAEIQEIVKSRIKNIKAAEENMTRLKPVLEYLARQHDIDPATLDTEDGMNALIKASGEDDSIYEEEAERRGLPVEAIKQIRQLEQEKEIRDKRDQETEQEQQMQQHFQRLVVDGMKVKEIYPSFDLQQELQNANFARLTSPMVGIDARTAYEIVHHDELQPQAMAFAAQKAQQKLAASVASGARRPLENGVTPGSAVDIRSDPSTLKLADFEEIKRRVARGEKISF